MCADDAVLQMLPEPFCTVDVVNAVDVLFNAMLDRSMCVAKLWKLLVARQFVCADRGACNDVCGDYWL